VSQPVNTLEQAIEQRRDSALGEAVESPVGDDENEPP